MTPRLIVSLTSHPGRIDTVLLAIESILDQSLLPDEIVLNLAREDFPTDHVNESLNRIKLLKIHYTSNYRSATKLIPTLRSHPHDIIVTIDDDRIYDKNLLEYLMNVHYKYPNVIICPVARKFHIDNICYDISHYLNHCMNTPGIGIFEGFAGVLYPPGALDPEVFNMHELRRLCPFADDVWFQVMAIKKGTKVMGIKAHRQSLIWPEEISNTQEKGLFRKHLRANGIMLKRCLIKYAMYGLLGHIKYNESCSSCSRLVEWDPLLFDYSKEYCPVCLNQQRKKVLCVGGYDYGNLGDYSYKVILGHYLGESFDVEFVTDTVRINEYGEYIPMGSDEEDLNYDALVVGGGGILYPWKSANSIKYYLDQCLERGKPYYFVSVGVAWDGMFDISRINSYLKEISRYISKASLCLVRSMNDYMVLSALSPNAFIQVIPDIACKLNEIYYTYLGLRPKKYITFIQTGSASIELEYVKKQIDNALIKYAGAQLIVINMGGSENPSDEKCDYREKHLFDLAQKYYPNAKVYYGLGISDKLKDLCYANAMTRKGDITLIELLGIITQSHMVYTGRYHGIILSKMLQIPYENLVFNYKNLSEENYPLDMNFCSKQLERLIYMLKHDYQVKWWKEWSEDDRNNYIVKLNEKTSQWNIPFIQAMTNEEIYLRLRTGM